jgi:peptidoglycan lytic transglycosylase
MCSISCARNPYVDIEARRIFLNTPSVSPAGLRKAAKLFAVILTSATLSACAQPSIVNNKSGLFATRQTSLNDTRASYGLASFYEEGAQTANGEKFDPHELTAAHPTLPLGTRLRVTNVATGRSVIVRINDRGPFVPGRVVDVSYAAAETLGIIGRGIAKVKLDVVQ